MRFHCLPTGLPMGGRADPVEILRKLRDRLDTRHTGLLVIDMQNDFCAEGGYIENVVGLDASPCRAIVKPIEELVLAAREHDVPVIWVAARYGVADIAANMRSKQLDISDEVCCEEGSWGAEHFGVQPGQGERIFLKHSYSAFTRTSLKEYAAENGIRTFIFAGVQTNVCVENSVRDAFCHGFYCVVAEDCVASHTRSLHDASMLNVRLLYGDVLDRQAINELWSYTAGKT